MSVPSGPLDVLNRMRAAAITRSETGMSRLVLTTRDGEITHLRDYANLLTVEAAIGAPA